MPLAVLVARIERLRDRELSALGVGGTEIEERAGRDIHHAVVVEVRRRGRPCVIEVAEALPLESAGRFFRRFHLRREISYRDFLEPDFAGAADIQRDRAEAFRPVAGPAAGDAGAATAAGAHRVERRPQDLGIDDDLDRVPFLRAKTDGRSGGTGVATATAAASSCRRAAARGRAATAGRRRSRHLATTGWRRSRATSGRRATAPASRRGWRNTRRAGAAAQGFPRNLLTLGVELQAVRRQVALIERHEGALHAVGCFFGAQQTPVLHPPMQRNDAKNPVS